MIVTENQISQVKEFSAFLCWEDQSGLAESIPLICTSAVWGRHPVFFTPWAPLGLTVGCGCSLMAAGWQVFFLSWVSSGSHWRGAISDDCDIIVYWCDRKYSTSHPQAMPDISWESSKADCTMLGFPRVASGKKIHLPMQEKRVQSLGWEDPLEEECGSPLQYSCLENSMDRGAWRATIHKVATEQLSTLTQALSNMWRNTKQFISIWLNQFSHGPCTVIWKQAVSRRAWCCRAEEHPIYKR